MRLAVVLGLLMLVTGCSSEGPANQFGMRCVVPVSELGGGGLQTFRYSLDLDRMLWCNADGLCGASPMEIVSVSDAEIVLHDDGEGRFVLHRAAGRLVNEGSQIYGDGDCTSEPYTPIAEREF